ncbi:STAS domain-containing protein [Streptomyces sp. NPDC057445]|uniref:STAS domain-containing protein n=1 Tax=Streptomyces sp. NPDC057445 TaxID=3346136 RepID=UPI0036D0BAD5
MREEPKVSHRLIDGVCLVRVEGDVDVDSAEPLKQTLMCTDTRRATGTVVDLSAVRFADSTMLHILLEAQRAHRASGLRLVISGPLGLIVERLFDVTGTTGFFTVAPSADTALEMAGTPRR